MSESREHPDYVWRFKLSDDDDETLCSDALSEMVRRELKALLGCVVLTQGGEELKVTGFRFLGEANAEHAIYPGLPEQHPRSEEAPGQSGVDDDATARGGLEGEGAPAGDLDIDHRP